MKHTFSNMMEDNLELELELDVDDEKEDMHVVSEPKPEPAPPSSSPSTPSRRYSKRQHTSRFTFTSSYGADYYDIDGIDLD